MSDLIRTAWTAGTVLGLTGGLAPVVCTLALGNEERPDPVIRFWARSILKAAGVQPLVRIPEHVPERFVMAINHQSLFDVLMLFAHLPRHMRFVAKAELFKIPVFGQSLHVLGNIKVDRTGSERDRQKIHAAARAVRERVSIVFFAEGTRSPDGRLRPFKRGAASLAIDSGVPLLPAAVAGTGEILPKGSAWIRGGQRAALVVGQPIPTEGLTEADREGLTARAHQEVAALLREAEEMVSSPA